MPNKESFFDKVYDIVRAIPYGKVSSYGAVGKSIGTGLSARMVGWAMNGSHAKMPLIPAHRVVNRNGLLTGKHHFETITMMQELLENEGLVIKDDQIINLEEHFWDPLIELNK